MPQEAAFFYPFGELFGLERHFDRVMEFYTSHATLGGRVPLSFGEELALVRLVGYCGLLQQRTLAPGVSCLVRR